MQKAAGESCTHLSPGLAWPFVHREQASPMPPVQIPVPAPCAVSAEDSKVTNCPSQQLARIHPSRTAPGSCPGVCKAVGSKIQKCLMVITSLCLTLSLSTSPNIWQKGWFSIFIRLREETEAPEGEQVAQGHQQASAEQGQGLLHRLLLPSCLSI